MNTIIQLITNKIFISFLIAVALAQLIKIIYYSIKHRKFDKIMLIETGGFPSTHSAVVSVLTTSVFLEQGISIAFIICLVFSIIIIRDAFGVRMDVQRHALLLEKLTKKKMNEHIGHTIPQVFCGIVLGIIVSVVMYLVL